MPSNNQYLKKRASTQISPSVGVSSDDDDSYAGVEQISEDEEDEPDVEKEEERAIIFSEDSIISLNTCTPQNFIEEPWEGFSDFPNTVEDMSLFGQDNLSEEEWYLRTEVKKDEETIEYATVNRERSVQLESSDDEFDMFDDLFPDIFINKDELDSSFRRQIDHDDISDDGSYWEHEVESTYCLPCANTHPVTETEKNDDYNEYDSDSSILTGYESDIGETTDDDLPAEYYLQHHRTTIRIPDVESDNERHSQNSSPARTPRLYSWKHTSDKPFATVSSNCKKMILFNVQDFRNFGSTNSSEHIPSIHQVNSKNFMISAIQNPTLLNFNAMMSAGLPELYAPLTIESGADLISYSSSCYDSDSLKEDNCAEKSPNLDEFINFESDDGSFKSCEVEPSPKCVEVDISTSKCPSISKEKEQLHPLISHFNRGVVGSWRQKQNTHKLLHRNIVSPDSLAFGGNRIMEGTLKGVKTGRLKHALTPITPVRSIKSHDILGDGSRAFKRRKIKM